MSEEEYEKLGSVLVFKRILSYKAPGVGKHILQSA